MKIRNIEIITQKMLSYKTTINSTNDGLRKLVNQVISQFYFLITRHGLDPRETWIV